MSGLNWDRVRRRTLQHLHGSTDGTPQGRAAYLSAWADRILAKAATKKGKGRRRRKARQPTAFRRIDAGTELKQDFRRDLAQ
jgi:hypothetical protein